MEAKIPRELRMEGREPEVVRTSEHRCSVELGEHVDLRADALDDGGADEDTGELAVGGPAPFERGLDRLALAAVAVATHRDAENDERRLVGAAVDDLGRAQDEP